MKVDTWQEGSELEQELWHSYEQQGMDLNLGSTGLLEQ